MIGCPFAALKDQRQKTYTIIAIGVGIMVCVIAYIHLTGKKRVNGTGSTFESTRETFDGSASHPIRVKKRARPKKSRREPFSTSSRSTDDK
ncbi:hypothetical protein DICVIV_05907 [Dictyocaulus viviparus]|uniref:Uncharacterized protein n=1 Tax=Dictyocaulus viviparus TaxID=29172 RepID=A0A0D8XU13_DICVI|nr:hypothetical protein DICVIV_05907 [Dictyocaulus viviparus]